MPTRGNAAGARICLDATQADDLATFVVSSVEGALLVARVRRDPQPVVDATERLAEMLQSALDALP